MSGREFIDCVRWGCEIARIAAAGGPLVLCTALWSTELGLSGFIGASLLGGSEPKPQC